MPGLVDALQAFNRRERHILVGWVFDRITFPLGHEFRDLMSEPFLPVRVPADAYIAMDYNLNWLTAALMWSASCVGEEDPRAYNTEEGIDLADSDTDLLVAFARGSETHVVLLEAKGYTRWNTKQLKGKSERLKRIFGDEGNRFSSVVPYWVFVSPGPPPYLEWAEWMLGPNGEARYLPLPQPATHRFAVARCDSKGDAKEGGYWKIRQDPWPGP
jgi:hypothetical protein